MWGTTTSARFLMVTLAALAACCAWGCDDAPPPKTAAKAVPKAKMPVPEDREILGKRTTEVKDAAKEVASGQAKAVGPRKVVGKDPITISGNAYVSIVGRASMLKIQQAVDLYQADKGEYPKTFEEFETGVLKANSIALPKLPAWQKYGYEVATHSLIVLEYPELKDQVDAEYDAKAGRKP